MWFAPATPEKAIAVISGSPVLVIEFQAYVLAMLGSVILWRSAFGYRRRGLPSAWAGYRAGIRDDIRLYPGVAVALLAIALIEAVTFNLLTDQDAHLGSRRRGPGGDSGTRGASGRARTADGGPAPIPADDPLGRRRSIGGPPTRPARAAQSPSCSRSSRKRLRSTPHS
ncbi:hypothetical protein GCM10009605_11280 [Nocardiopsis composta]